MMFPIGLQFILGRNLEESTRQYEQLVGDNAGATAAAANAAQSKKYLMDSEDIKASMT
jgi:hypothetical protein